MFQGLEVGQHWRDAFLALWEMIEDEVQVTSKLEKGKLRRPTLPSLPSEVCNVYVPSGVAADPVSGSKR
eukprot:1088687-Prymnesium_polylepis.4